MKKIIIAILAVMLMASYSWAAGSSVQTVKQYTGGFVVVSIACTGDVANGSIPTVTLSADIMALIEGTHYLYLVSAYPTSGGTAPDAADVTVVMGGVDLLGEKGVNLIHATNRQDTFPYSVFMTSYRFSAVTGQITLTVANQATASANYTLELVFVR